ncbi:MAG TPA: P-loop NTPase, partial [Caulobacteraceae bacterium]|nr:P-loop NTPase [Caulobacteraceae bacterium]
MDLKDRLSALQWHGLSLAESSTSIKVAQGDAGVAVSLVAGFPVGGGVHSGLRTLVEAAVAPGRLAGFECSARIAAHAPQPPLGPSPRIRNLIAVGSGKGGVGKSTTAVNLALALQAEGLRVGILDADLYGPSLPKLLGIDDRTAIRDDGIFAPHEVFGLKAMSIGSMLVKDQAVVWRGPMAT